MLKNFGSAGEMMFQEGIIDAAIWVVYAWADAPRNHAAVMVTGDDKAKVSATAENLAQYFWRVRADFEFVAPAATIEESLDQAIASDEKPFIISDTGVNPTAGGAGGVTWTLARILEGPEFQSENGPSLIYASITGSEFVKKAVEIGVGEKIDARTCARVDDRFEPPARLNGTIEAIEHGDEDAETEVVVKDGAPVYSGNPFFCLLLSLESTNYSL